jgi:hypothetical protein
LLEVQRAVGDTADSLPLEHTPYFEFGKDCKELLKSFVDMYPTLMFFISRAFSALPMLIEGPDDHGGYGHCAKEAQSQQGVEQDQVWSFGLGQVFVALRVMQTTHI